MILYNGNNIFLGMGGSELSLLGFEDMDEFRSYHNDVADLFVNKPGYIFKFHNFSWIEYALHSGAANKQAIVKTKSGKNIEVTLSIYEIFLSEETLGSKHCFAIELKSTPKKNTELASDFQRNDEITPINEIQSSAILFETPSDDIISPVEDIVHNNNVVPMPPIPTTFQEASSFEKVLVSSEAFNTGESTPVLFDDESLSVDMEISDKQGESLGVKNNVADYSYKKTSQPFNLTEGAEKLGLDLASFAMLINEYLADLDTQMKHISKAITQNNSTLALGILSQLQDAASLLQIPELMKHFSCLEKSLRESDEEEQLQVLLLSENAINHFRHSLQ